MSITYVCCVPSCANGADIGYTDLDKKHFKFLKLKPGEEPGICDPCWNRHCDKDDKFDLKAILTGEMKVPRRPGRAKTQAAPKQPSSSLKLKRLKDFTRPKARAQYKFGNADIWNEVHGGPWFIQEGDSDMVTVKNLKEAKAHLGSQ